jgi:hypothetical protein
MDRRILLYDSRVNVKRRQCGYLLEIPLIVALVVIVAVVIGPMLPPLGQKLVVIGAGLVVIAGAYYDIVIPGWRPRPRLAPPWSWIVFGAVATLVAVGAGAFAVYK